MKPDIQQTVEDLRQLPEDQQTAILERFRDMVTRAKLEAELAEAEARGGETPASALFTRLKKQYGG